MEENPDSVVVENRPTKRNIGEVFEENKTEIIKKIKPEKSEIEQEDEKPVNPPTILIGDGNGTTGKEEESRVVTPPPTSLSSHSEPIISRPKMKPLVPSKGMSNVMSEIRKAKLMVTNIVKKEFGDVGKTVLAQMEEGEDDVIINDEAVAVVAEKERLTELDVGITQFIGEAEGFQGIIKHRYTDFLVNEIDLEGKPVHLTDLETLPVDQNIQIDIVKDLLNETELKHLEELNDKKQTEFLLIDATEMSKEQRTQLHQSLRQNFAGVYSSTTNDGDRRLIQVRPITDFSRVKKGLDRRQSWPSYRPNYAHFVLYKENVDTMRAIGILTSAMGMRPSSLSYAGTKDKRAVTSQAVSGFQIEGKKLLGLNKKLRNMKIGNISYKKTALQLGDLSGNRFTIILRKMCGSDQVVDESMRLLRERGFINYYGMQRFGTTSVPTHSVGRALIMNRFEDAIDLILAPREGDEKSLALARKTWLETRDPKLSFRQLYASKRHSIEGQLLQSLSQHGANDFVNALSGLPRNVRLMYLHSYQSLIWNKMASKRIAAMGLEPREGDLWLMPNPNPLSAGGDSTSPCPPQPHTTKAKDILDSENPKEIPEKGTKEKPLVVTKEDIEANKVSIEDIVLPLPGFDVIYPQNQVFEWYKEALAEDDMNLDSFKTRVKTYCLGGSYRYVLVKPKDVSWSVINYSSDAPDQDMAITDKDRLEKKASSKALEKDMTITGKDGLDQKAFSATLDKAEVPDQDQSEVPDQDMAVTEKKEELKEGVATIDNDLRALELKFTLPSSCYATMAIRQITRRDTSSWTQY